MKGSTQNGPTCRIPNTGLELKPEASSRSEKSLLVGLYGKKRSLRKALKAHTIGTRLLKGSVAVALLIQGAKSNGWCVRG